MYSTLCADTCHGVRDSAVNGMNFLRCVLTHSFPIYTFSLPPENTRKPYGFLMFSKGRERVYWEHVG